MKKKKILWAIHPFASDAPILRSAVRCLRDWVRAEPAWIEPVYVASSFRSVEQGSRAKVQSHGQAVIDRSGPPGSIPGLKPLRVLSKPVTSVRQEVRELVAYAKRSGADLIVISSHGRTGAERWLLGSFAETLEPGFGRSAPHCPSPPQTHLGFQDGAFSHRLFGGVTGGLGPRPGVRR
jgi:nucleotide-binding universal stress UspA family protein